MHIGLSLLSLAILIASAIVLGIVEHHRGCDNPHAPAPAVNSLRCVLPPACATFQEYLCGSTAASVAVINRLCATRAEGEASVLDIRRDPLPVAVACEVLALIGTDDIAAYDPSGRVLDLCFTVPLGERGLDALTTSSGIAPACLRPLQEVGVTNPEDSRTRSAALRAQTLIEQIKECQRPDFL